MTVWGVRDFYSNLEVRCEEGCELNRGYLALVVASTLLGVGGLLSNNVAIIIGSMCVAPFLSSSRAICIGIIYRKWKCVSFGLLKQVIGLLVMAPLLSFICTIIFKNVFSMIIITPEIMVRTLPTIKDLFLAIFVAIVSGATSSLALVALPRIISEPYEEMLDVIIGVGIAISLILPASIIGIGLAFGRFDLTFQSFVILIINLIGLNIVGSISILHLWGIKPELLEIENNIKSTTENLITKIIKAHRVSTRVTLFSRKKVDVFIRLYTLEVHEHAINLIDQLLAKRVSEEIKSKTGMSNRVRIVIHPVSTYSQF